MQLDPMGFLSYTHFDDDHNKGKLTKFAEQLSGEVRAQTGEEFIIFQDRKSLNWGDNWKKQIEDSLNEVTFLFPIITPSYFKSSPCREELELFINREKRLRKRNLIFPIYFIETEELENKGRTNDELVKVISSRQYEDWRAYRFDNFNTKEVNKQFEKLARSIKIKLKDISTADDKKLISKSFEKKSNNNMKSRKMSRNNISPYDYITLLPDDLHIQETLYANIKSNENDDLFIKGRYKKNNNNGLYVALLTYDIEKKKWKKVFDKDIEPFTAINSYTNKMLDNNNDVLIITTKAGSGGFLSYTVIGYKENEFKILLQRNNIFQGQLRILNNQLIEKKGKQAILFEWNGTYILGTQLITEPHIPYSLDDKRIAYSIDKEENVLIQDTNVTLYRGQKLYLIRENTGVTERILYRAGGALTYEEEYFLACKIGNTQISIIPSGYNWDKSINIEVEVIDR
ncbi:TIR domain-containing protein [Iocasia frigidifontis]|uniref:TIR domain-containing protein n=1 Tax=Iocasia fonsfrigidae TaxID=2682810 RepID=A0A8A7KG09_9FIRM|nr:toll/interleukin-1 receptor domain-containing protein [Iocasia fonsfrigidae]QTL97827.1 TIR domain-containing protein [Iocasia fonsfrigidae]